VTALTYFGWTLVETPQSFHTIPHASATFRTLPYYSITFHRTLEAASNEETVQEQTTASRKLLDMPLALCI
jgi:hypothetical protein